MCLNDLYVMLLLCVNVQFMYNVCCVSVSLHLFPFSIFQIILLSIVFQINCHEAENLIVIPLKIGM